MPRKIHRTRRPRTGQALVTLFSLAATAYFTHHAVHGRHGLAAQSTLMDRSVLLEFELASLEAAHAKLARDVALLAPDVPHPDLVQEIARDVLGFAHPEERVLLDP